MVSVSTREVDNSFTEVTLTSSYALEAGATQEFTGMMRCCFSAAKNFKINGLSMMDEVNEEIKRLNRSYITEQNGGTSGGITPVEPDAEVMVNGYQISTTAEGFRTVYTVDDPSNEVESVGMVYGLADYVKASDMVVNSTNSKVCDCAGTEAGKYSNAVIDSNSASSYVMTMTFVKSKEFYSSEMYVRAYAKLKNGKYIYSDTESVSVYDISDYLYQNKIMNTYNGHVYLFDNILSVVDSAYKEIAYNWNNTLVK